MLTNVLAALSCVCRKFEADQDQMRREIYARNAVMRLWSERKMALFHDEMTRKAGGGVVDQSSLALQQGV